MKKLTLLLLCLAIFALCNGCSLKEQPSVMDADAETRWKAFMQQASHPSKYDMLSGSLRFGSENDTQRVTYLLWSQDNVNINALLYGHDSTELSAVNSIPDMPSNTRAIRLEINAGVGANVVKALFNNGRMLVVLPHDGKAYIGVESTENIRRLMGLDLPFSINSLNDFLVGRYLSALDTPSPERYFTSNNGNIIYQYREKGRMCELELNTNALPVRWSMDGYWTLNISYDDNALPYKLDGRTGGEERMRMVLLVKKRLPANAIPERSMTLDVPQNFAVYLLDQ